MDSIYNTQYTINIMKKINEFNNELDKLSVIEDKYESLYIFTIYDKTTKDLIKYLFEYLKKIKNISNGFKKKYLNDRIYSFIELLQEEGSDDVVNKIYFIGENIFQFNLFDVSIELFKNYNIDNIIIKYGDKYNIDFIKEFLFDDSIKHLIEEHNSKFFHYHINKSKGRRLHNEFYLKKVDIVDYMNTIFVGDKIVYLGNAINIKKVSVEKYIAIDRRVNDTQIFELFEKDILIQNNKKLQVIMGCITNTKMMDKILFGSDLVKAIKNHQVKTICCTQKMKDKLHKVYSVDYLNFEILVVKSFDDGDSTFILESNYKGIIGLKYF